MGTKRVKSYSSEFREQILKKCIETNRYNTRLEEIGLDPWKEHFPKLYNSLLVERNKNWIPQIDPSF